MPGLTIGNNDDCRCGGCVGGAGAACGAGAGEDLRDEDHAADAERAPDLFAKTFGAAVEKESGGRIKAEVYPASQLGPMPRQIEGTQFGSIQCAMIPPEFFVGVDERFEVLAAPGLVDPLEQASASPPIPVVLEADARAWRQQGTCAASACSCRGVACRRARRSATSTDFKGKKIRIFASEFQRIAFQRLGASPIAMSPSDVLVAIQQGTLDGAVAGSQLPGRPAIPGRREVHHDDTPCLDLHRRRVQQANGSSRCPRTCGRSSSASPRSESKAITSGRGRDHQGCAQELDRRAAAN